MIEMTFSGFAYLLFLTLIWLGVFVGEQLGSCKLGHFKKLMSICIVFSIFYLEKFYIYIPEVFWPAIAWNWVVIGGVSLLISYPVVRRRLENFCNREFFSSYWHCGSYTLMAMIASLVAGIASFFQDRYKAVLIVVLFVFGIIIAWLCARVIIYFMGCGKNKVWAGNLLSGLLLQVAGYIFFRESVYYWLGAYCLILGQLLSLSIDLYLREKKRAKDPAHC